MSLAQLFFMKETFRESVRRWRQACFRKRSHTQREQRFTLEALEPRVLLSATPTEVVPLQTFVEPHDAPLVQGLVQGQVADAVNQTPTAIPDIDTAQAGLDPVAIRSLLGAAITQLSSLGVDNDALNTLAGTEITITDLSGFKLGETQDKHIWLDRDAGGHGWFVDTTPADNMEFSGTGIGDWRAVEGGPAANHVDLLTVLSHELGHVLGLSHLDAANAGYGFMQEDIRPGVRRLPLSDSSAPVVLPEMETLISVMADSSRGTGGFAVVGQDQALVITPTISWVSDTNGFWDVAGNWLDSNSVARLPNATDDVLIDRGAENPTITIRTSDPIAFNLVNAETVIVSTGATLTVERTLSSPGSFQLAGGTLSKATIEAGTTVTGGANATVTGAGGLDQLTVSGTIVPLSQMTVTGGLTFNAGGLFLLGIGGDFSAFVQVNGDQTIGGPGEIRFVGSGNQLVLNNAVTFGSDLTVHGVGADIRGSGSLTNQGTITADGGGIISIGSTGQSWTNAAGGTLKADGGTLSLLGNWSNAGQIVVNNSTLNLGGSFTTAGIGTITRTGGSVNMTGALDNTGATLVLNDTTGSWGAVSGSITGGTIQASGAAQITQSLGSFTLVGITALNARWTMLGGNGSTTLNVRGDLVLNSTMVLNGSGNLVFAGAAGTTQNILTTGAGVIRLADFLEIHHRTAFVTQSIDSGSGSAARTVVIHSGVTIQGSAGNEELAEIGAAGQIWVNQGTIAALASGANLTIRGRFYNEGTIIAEADTFVSLIGESLAADQLGWTNFGPTNNPGTIQVSGGTLSLDGNWSNFAGAPPIVPSTIQLTSGTLNLGGSFTTTAIGTINRSGGSVNMTGALDNTGATLVLDDTKGSWNLVNGTLRQGSLATSGGAVLVAASGTLDGVTLGATVGGVPFSATVQGNGGGFTVTGGLTFANGSVVDLGNQMRLTGDQIVGGDGEIRFRGAAAGISNFNQTTFGPGLTIHRSDANSGSITIVGGSITNQGTIRADAGGQIGVVGNNPGTTFTNAVGGVLAAEGGTLVLDTNTTNYVAGTLTGGTWQAIGNSTLQITGADITTNAATLVLDGVGARLTKDNAGTSALANLSSNAAAGSVTLRNRAMLVLAGSFNNAGVLTLGPGSTLQTGREGQYASTVLGFSSQTSAGGWSAAQSLGAPNTLSYGDLATAWAPSSQNSTLEFLTLGFATPVSSDGVTIRETFGNGFVYQVDVVDTSDVGHPVWTGTDPSLPGAPVDFQALWSATPYLVKGVKIYVDTNHNTGSYEEIDSVQLLTAGTGNYRQTGNATLAVEVGGTPASGQFGRLVAIDNAALDGTLDLRLVNGYGPDPGLHFQIVSFSGHTGSFSTINGLTVGGTPLFEAVYDASSVTLNSLAVPTDLAFVSANPPATIIAGQQVAVPYRVQNLTGTPAAGSWFDSLYLSTDGVLDPSDVLLGRFEHQGGVAGNASYTETLNAIVPALAEGNYRVIVLADSRRAVPQGNGANDVGASAATTSLSVPVLALGGSASATIANGQDLYYKLVAPPGKDIKINADFTAAFQAELYVRLGGLPDRTNFDQAAAPGDLHPLLLLANPSGGVYYVLLHGREGAAGAAPFTLKAAAAGFEIISLTPTRGSNQLTAYIQIVGSQFTPQTTVTLQRVGGPIDATRTALSVEFVNSTHLNTRFDLQGLPTGSYTVSANDAGHIAVALDIFTIANDPVGGLTALPYLLAPEFIRVGASFTVTFGFMNDSNYAEAFAPFIVLTATNVDASQTHREIGIPPDTLLGLVKPGEVVSFSVVYTPDPKGDGVSSGITTAVINPSTTVIDWDGQKSSERPSTIAPDAWDAIWANLRPELGNTLSDLFAVLERDSVALLGPSITEVDRLFMFEMRKANDLPALPVPAGAVDLGFPAPSLPLVFGRAFGSSIADRYHVGRLGRGWVDNLDISIAEDAASGLVTLHQGESLRAFARQLDGSYVSFPGDHATLTKVNGAFRLGEISGGVMAFRTDGMLDYIEDTNSNRLTAGYSGAQLTSLTHSDGSVLTLAYNAQNRVSQVTDPAGRKAIYTYDVSGEHLVSVTTPDGTTDYTYTPDATGPKAHALASISYRDGTHLFFAYDSHGRLAQQERDGGAQALTVTYGAASFTVTDAFGHSTQSFFDDTGRIVATIDPLHNAGKMTYDNGNNLTSAHVVGNPPATFEYDTHGNPVRVLDPLGEHQEFTYATTFNNLTSWRDALDHPTNFTYDANGNLLTITSADGTSGQFAYDAQGNVVGSVNHRGQTVTYSYNSLGLPTRKNLPDGTHVDYVYDNRGNMLSATDAAGATTMTYDLADRLTKITYPGGRFLEYSYDTGGRRVSMRDQDGFTVNYRYDVVGRLAELTDGQGQRSVAYEYDAAGRLTRESRGNGTVTTYQYDEAGKVLHLIHVAPDATVLSQFDYTYDGLGRRTSMTTLEGETTYGYDAAGRLTFVSLPGGRTITYAYDVEGNRTTVTDNGMSTAYSVNNLNQYLTIGATGQGFDADGNQISSNDPGGSRTYTYDVQGRLVRIVSPQDTWTYAYDALGNRVASTHNGVQTQYLIDRGGLGNIAAEYDGAGKLRAHYVQGGGLVSRVDAAGPAAYYQFDAAGNTAQLTGAGGAVLNSYSYLPFGEQLSASETVSNPFTYVGQFGVMHESSGLDFMRNRWYDPAQGRFTQEDPIGMAGGTNMYAYAGGNPISLIDPSGLNPLLPFAITLVAPYVSEAAFAAAGIDVAVMAAADTAAAVAFVTANASYIATITGGVTAAPVAVSVVGELGEGILIGIGIGVTAIGGLVIGFEAAYALNYLKYGDTPMCVPNVPLFLQPFCHEAPRPVGLVGGTTQVTQRAVSKDPNDMVGPGGVGAGRFVENGAFPYSILFENQPDAAGPAALVVVTQRLDDDLDLDTFALGDIGFGDVNVSVPADRQFYSTRLDLRATRGLFVDVTADLDRPTRVVTWTLRALDPVTLDIPSDPFVGFLPPDKNQPEGQGYVNYFVQPKTGSPTGTRIDAQATIVFDSNAPIDTPAIFNTLDVGPPASSITALPTAIFTPSFTVSWSGVDDAGGSGVASFDVFVSDNGGAFTAFLTSTTQTSALFTGLNGHSYQFYSVATDHVGHRETAPATFDTVTTVQLATIQGLAFDDVNVDGVRNGGEQVLAGRTIFIDANNDGLLSAGEASAMTDATGAYGLANLSPGTYQIAELLPTGWFQTAPLVVQTVVIAGGEVQTSKNFGSLRATLDVDGNGNADALSDGIAIVRNLFGFTGDALINGVVDPNGKRATAQAVEGYLSGVRPLMLDVDGNGQADALSDGILIVRYLFGFTGGALTNGVVDPAGTRHTAAAVEAFLNGFLPVSSPSVQTQSIVASAPLAASAPTTTITTTASDAPAPSVSLVEMERDTATATTATVTDSNYGQAYVQQAWVKAYVNESVVTHDDEVEDELVIQLQEPVLV